MNACEILTKDPHSNGCQLKFKHWWGYKCQFDTGFTVLRWYKINFPKWVLHRNSDFKRLFLKNMNFLWYVQISCTDYLISTKFITDFNKCIWITWRSQKKNSLLWLLYEIKYRGKTANMLKLVFTALCGAASSFLQYYNKNVK